MTGTIKIPIKNLLLHISNVINACDFSSVTPSRVKQYLKYRFKNALPSEDDLDIILKNVIKSVKLSQALNGGSVHFREVNYDNLDTYEAKLKDTMVEYETEDYVLTKEGLPKERVINSNIKRVDPCHYALQNLTPKALGNIRGFVKQKRKQNGFVQRKRMFYKSLAKIMKRRFLEQKFLVQKKRKHLGEIVEPSRVLQKKTKHPKKGPSKVLQENTKCPKKKQTGSVQRKRTKVPRQKTKCPKKEPSSVLQENTKRTKKGPSEVLQENTKCAKKGPSEVLQEDTKCAKKKQTGSVQRKRTKVPRQKTKCPKKEPSRDLQENTKHTKKTKEKPLSMDRMNENSVWNSRVTGELKLRIKRSLPMEPYHGEDTESKTVPKKKQKTNTKNLAEKNVPKRKYVTRLNLLSYLRENFRALSDKQLNDILKDTNDEVTAIIRCSELCN